jgi:hypothetical protein
MKFKIIGVVLAVFMGFGVALADDQPSLQDVVAQLQAMQQRIDALEGQLDLAKSISAPTGPSNDDIRAMIQEQMASAPGAVPAWLDNLTFAGKLRMRYEWRGKEQSAHNASSWGDERNRVRYQLLFGFEKALTEEFTAGFELASGAWDSTVNGSGSTSHNETLGDSFFKDPIYINRAYMIYRPAQVEGLTVIGGKFKNNFDTVDSQMMWDRDTTPEGFLARYDISGCDTVHPWVQAAYLIVTENTSDLSNSDDSDVMAFQAGATANLQDGVTVTGAATYYHFSDFEDTVVNSIPNVYLTNFKVIELAGEVGFNAVDLPCSVFADWAHNTDQNTGQNNDRDAWKAGLRVGKVKKPGDWGFQYDYSYVKMGAFTDEFANSEYGFVNYRGHAANVSYGLFDNTTLGLTVYCLDDLHDVSASDSFLMTQLDLVTEF